MKISLYDENLVKVLDCENIFVSCLWKEQYNGLGNFLLEVNATDLNKKIIRPDLYAKRQGEPSLMIIKSVEIKNEKIVASGFSACRTLDDVAYAGKFAENSTIATSILTAYNNSNKYKNVVFELSALKETYAEEIKNKTVYKLMETMCKDADIGFRAVKDEKKVKIQLYKPKINAQARFNSGFGNLSSPHIKLSTKQYKNYCVVVSEIAKVIVDKSNGTEKREMIIDSYLTQEQGESLDHYKKRLVAEGAEALLKQEKSIDCDFLPTDDIAKLGDIVSASLNDYGLRFNTRIVSVSIKEQKGKTTTSYEVGELNFTKE